jgi:carbon monoxide dehydrogenase subunit G
MKVEGQHTFDASRATVWSTILDPEVIASIMPGCDALERTGENSFQGAMKIKVGPVQGLFQGEVELSDLREGESYHIRIQGKGAPGFVDAEGDVRFRAEGGKTVLAYEIDAKIGGRIASVGQRLLESSTKVIARQSLEGLAEQVRARGGTGAAAPRSSIGDAGPLWLALGLAHGVLEDMVPEKARPIAGLGLGLGAGVGFVCILLFAFMKACGG